MKTPALTAAEFADMANPKHNVRPVTDEEGRELLGRLDGWIGIALRHLGTHGTLVVSQLKPLLDNPYPHFPAAQRTLLVMADTGLITVRSDVASLTPKGKAALKG